VVLADKGVAKAELIGEYDLGKVLVVSLRGGGMRAKAVREKSKFHFQSSMCGRHVTTPAAA